MTYDTYFRDSPLSPPCWKTMIIFLNEFTYNWMYTVLLSHQRFLWVACFHRNVPRKQFGRWRIFFLSQHIANSSGSPWSTFHSFYLILIIFIIVVGLWVDSGLKLLTSFQDTLSPTRMTGACTARSEPGGVTQTCSLHKWSKGPEAGEQLCGLIRITKSVLAKNH